MNKIEVLDCTLRDGGYCNQWRFEHDNIHKIIMGLVEAGIEIIECGFLTKCGKSDSDTTRFHAMEDMLPFIQGKGRDTLFVAMINYGEYAAEDLPERGKASVDGIRIAFHKKDMSGAIALCKEVQKKGYLVFVQPMVSISYSDEEFLYLITSVNEFHPYAFYIVDSFGMMKEKELLRLFYLVEHNLKGSTRIGFHSHNNMQLAFSNAQRLVAMHTDRDLIVDASVYGMGRGAGNLNTELFVEFLNGSVGSAYKLKPLLFIIDEIINEFYQKNYWGYSLPNYLSAKHNAHPNYAKFLDDQKTLTVEDMESIFEMMNEMKVLEFDRDYVEDLYIRYMDRGRIQEDRQEELEKVLNGKRILLIAPGKSSVDERELICQYLGGDDIVSISVNFEYPYANTDYIFISNLRRFKELDADKKTKCIVTSNISDINVYFQANYRELLNKEENVRDKAGLMVIRFLMNYGVTEIMLAGFDGYSHDMEENYGEKKMAFFTRRAILDAMNNEMKKVIREYAKKIKITFLTSPRHIRI